MITSAQCRAARGLLDWTQQRLAEEARVGVVTVRQLEAGDTAPRRATLEVIQRALERAGVQLINENGGGPGRAAAQALAAKWSFKNDRTKSFLDINRVKQSANFQGVPSCAPFSVALDVINDRAHRLQRLVVAFVRGFCELFPQAAIRPLCDHRAS